MNRIDSIKLKIERAERHIDDLNNRINIFRKSEPYAIGAKAHPVAEIRHTTLYVACVDSVPNDFALIAGDAVHNLRSSLDHLAWQLVEAGGGTPNRDTYFPICRTPQQYASAAGKQQIKAMPVEAQVALRAVQPFITFDDTLADIHDLDLIDKHRLLLTVSTFMTDWQAIVSGDLTIPFFEIPRSLIAGDEIANIPTATYDRTGHRNFKLGIDVAFGQSEVLAGKSVLDALKNMLNVVNDVAGVFRAFLT